MTAHDSEVKRIALCQFAERIHSDENFEELINHMVKGLVNKLKDMKSIEGNQNEINDTIRMIQLTDQFKLKIKNLSIDYEKIVKRLNR